MITSGSFGNVYILLALIMTAPALWLIMMDTGNKKTEVIIRIVRRLLLIVALSMAVIGIIKL